MGDSFMSNTWSTKNYKDVLNFVGGQRVETTLQDIDSGTFSLPMVIL